MKKIFTLLTVFVLSLMVANAQISGNAIKKFNGELKKSPKAGVASPKILKAKSTPNKIAMDSDEHLIGFYTTDDLPDMTYGGYGVTWNPGQLKAGVLYDDEVLHNYYGGQITKVRFALGAEVPVANVEIYEVDPTTMDTENAPCVSHTEFTGTPQVGWNDVTLDTPVTIESGKDYIVSYEYTQIEDTEDALAYPLVTDYDLDVDIIPEYGFLVYGYWEDYYVWDWYTFNNDYYYYGNLCIQAVVKGGGIPEDLAIRNLDMPKYATAGGEISYSFNIRNDGNTVPTSYTISISLDGTVVETLDTPIAVTSNYQTISGTLTLSSDISDGSHDVVFKVETINGNVPTENTDNDILESSFTVYEGFVDRQMNLIENFTSVQCTYCPLGHEVLEKMQELYPGKYAWVAIHGIGMGSDPYYLTDGSSDYFETLAYPYGTMYPAGVFNRYIYNDDTLNGSGTLSLSLGYSSAYQAAAATLINAAVDEVYDNIPAFASVEIETSYNAETRALYIMVYGEGVSSAKEFLDGNRLTVYLTEDSLVYTQINLGTYDANYVHNNVLRLIANEYAWGDDIGWTSDTSYENNYKVILDDSWNADNMHVVAFISKGYAHYIEDDGWYYNDMDDVYVNNANMVKVETSTGIKTAIVDSDVTEMSRYTTDGRQISAPVKGLNIVKMSDGTARKVIVK